MRNRLFLAVFTLIIAGLFFAAPALAEIETMTVSEIQPGMTGYGRTVIRGTEIETFQVEIIDVFTNLGYDGGSLIFMRISGDIVDESGGIAGGYSGSPIFIDGKLIGALSWGPYFTEGDVCGATPIHNMLRAFTYPEEEPERITSAPTCLDEPVDVGGRTFDSIILADSGVQAELLDNQLGGDTLILTPCKTPLIVSGLSQAGFERLQEFAADRLSTVELVQGPGGGETQGVPILIGPTYLEPGASIGAQLATGDLDLTAVGTLTWIDDDGRFLAFGHPFLGEGETNMPFVTTDIVYTMPALDRSYKMGEPIDIVGTCTIDRLTTIGGMLREIPEMVDFSLTVIDHDVGRTRRFNYSVINQEEWLPLLGWLMPMEAVMYASDRVGAATCRVSFSIRGEGLAEPIERDNLFYAGYGASAALYEFYEALNMVTTGNPYREVKITDVDMEIEITSTRQTMDILKARFSNAPNMGPGALGYTGPESMDDKEAKDEANREPTDIPMPSMEELQDMPMEDLEMYMNDMGMMEDYAAEMPVTGLVQYHPGDKIEVVVTLRPWREEPIEKIIELEIPEDFPPGQTTLEIFGGSSGAYYSMYYTDGYYMPMYGQPEDLDEIIEDFMARDTANTIVMRLMRIGTEIEDPYYYLQDEIETPEETRAILTMEDVIYGYYSLPIEIAGEGGPEVVDPMAPAEEMIEPEPIQEEPSGSRNPWRN